MPQWHELTPLGASRFLAHQHEARRPEPLADVLVRRLGAGDDIFPPQVLCEETHRVVPERRPRVSVILDDLPALDLENKRHLGFDHFRDRLDFAFGSRREQRQRVGAQCLERPEHVAALDLQRRPEGIRLGQLDQGFRRNSRPPPDIVCGDEPLVGLGNAHGCPLTIPIPIGSARRSVPGISSIVQSHRLACT